MGWAVRVLCEVGQGFVVSNGRKQNHVQGAQYLPQREILQACCLSQESVSLLIIDNIDLLLQIEDKEKEGKLCSKTLFPKLCSNFQN